MTCLTIRAATVSIGHACPACGKECADPGITWTEAGKKFIAVVCDTESGLPLCRDCSQAEASSVRRIVDRLMDDGDLLYDFSPAQATRGAP